MAEMLGELSPSTASVTRPGDRSSDQSERGGWGSDRGGSLNLGALGPSDSAAARDFRGLGPCIVATSSHCRNGGAETCGLPRWRAALLGDGIIEVDSKPF